MTKAEYDKIKAAKLANPNAGRGVLARLAGVSPIFTDLVDMCAWADRMIKPFSGIEEQLSRSDD